VKVLCWVSRAGHRTLLFFLAYMALAALASGQGTDARQETTAKLPEFEVAVIKPHPKGPMITTIEWPPGRFEATNVTAKILVKEAFNVPDDQISGWPDWAESQRFDVVAKIADAQWAEMSKLDSHRQYQSIQLMLQSLLRERFQLAIRHKPEKLMSYALVVAKGGAKLRVPEAPKRTDPLDSGESFLTIDRKDVPLTELANFLSPHFKRAVLDQTGLSGKYDISLQVAIPEGSSSEEVEAAISKALEKQLGLTLVLRREVVDTIVIERLEQPSEN
jgi:bla regulator protein blaR1